MDEQGGSNAGPSRAWLIGLLAFGLVLRLVAAWTSTGTMHPDEHQQYIEQSFRLVHGYGSTLWEQDAGLRHPLFTMMLAGILWVGERAGISDPFVLAALQRIVLAIISFAALSALTLSVHTRGRRIAGLVLAILLACNVDLVFIQVRVMSENMTIAVLALTLVCWPSRPAITGLLLGGMIALRLQTLPLAAGFWAVAAWEAVRKTAADSFRRWLALSAGLAAAVFAMGAMDAAYYGEWFHSARTNIRLQALGDVASSYGTTPVYAYLLTGGATLLRVSVVAIPLLALGAWRRPDLAAVALLFFIAHSIVPHKEARYIWPMAPIVCVLMAIGLEDWYRRHRPISRTVCAALILSVAVPSLARIGQIKWRTEAYAASCDGLARIGRSPDVRGVVLIDMPQFIAGNYFFLRTPVPIRYVQMTELGKLAVDPTWQDGQLNYVFAPRDGLSPAIRDDLRCISTYGKWAVYVKAVGSPEAHAAAGRHD